MKQNKNYCSECAIMRIFTKTPANIELMPRAEELDVFRMHHNRGVECRVRDFDEWSERAGCKEASCEVCAKFRKE